MNGRFFYLGNFLLLYTFYGLNPIAAKDSASAIPDLKLKLYIEAVSKSLKQFLFQCLFS